jgi:hypothetical protein
MINAKDTFYIMLRDRIATLNPARTMVLRGVTRPGVLVEENELATNDVVPDVFRLRWTALQIDAQGPLPLATMTCEILYATEGNSGNGGMDRGRLLAQMDEELSAALRATPHHIVKTNYATSFGVAPVVMATNVFWSDAVFTPTVVAAERLERVATVEVFCYQEAGE